MKVSKTGFLCQIHDKEGERVREGNKQTGFWVWEWDINHTTHRRQPGRRKEFTLNPKFKIKIKILLINEPGLSCGSNKINTQLMPNADKR